jgi:acetyl esterase/lipase
VILHRVSDWNNAYANGINIPGGDKYPGAWAEPAERFRNELVSQGRAEIDLVYGPKPRNRFDLFMPEGKPKGLVVHIHGGFWRMLDKSYGSNLAAGPLAHGFAVGMPTYTLAPEARVADIVREVAAAVDHLAGLIEGPVRLAGHSAGGHLATRMVTTTSPLSEDVKARVEHVVSISGLHDLRPLLQLAINADMRIDAAEAEAESPALLRPIENTRLTCWVGGGERAEFIRQSALLANIWTGLGASTALVEEPDRHHFSIIDGLADADHPLTRTLCEG